ncbi:MAG: SLBB domain-containing protein [Armatimonadota bacterium]|nr:SLBB domain-containing protein [Armatimonadota bacterium]MDR7464891.1 SLBB domain-containing protein [Armatimonadota bacterium]MDR7470925.1 SLBB domain-containing protein [Armatimonadota bacterium]MDR7474641.1 SLBB domain-containing protein [Armatimonadota bacterium]
MRVRLFAFLLSSLLASAVTYAAAAPAPSDLYVLGPGDTIEIVVFGEPDLSRTVTIKPDGTISLPLIGEVKAAGKTTAQLVAELTNLYKKYLKAPSVSVVVRELRVERIYILGQVNRPGEYQVRQGMGILELLASAGGPTTRADLAKAVIIRGKTETIQLNLLQAFATNTNPDVKLQPGDVLFIPETDRRIVVLGQVNRPGAYDLLEGQRVSDLIAAAGGVTTKAALTRAFIVRNNEQIAVDLAKVLAGNVEANVALKAGDMLVVPEFQNRIAVLGAVNRPGTYDLEEGMKLIDAVALAGGRTDRGNLSQVVVIRLDGGKTTTLTANVDRALSGDLSQNIPLRHGDVVFVPERGITVGTVLQYLNVFNLIRILFGGF